MPATRLVISIFSERSAIERNAKARKHDIKQKNAADDLINAEAAVERLLIEMTAMRLRDLLALGEPAHQVDRRVCKIIEWQQDCGRQVAASRE